MKEASIIATGVVDGVTIGRVTCPVIAEREGRVVVSEAMASGRGTSGKVALDLSSVNMISSSGLGALITISKESKELGGGLVLFGLNKDLEKLIKLTKLDRLFGMKLDQAAAIKALK